MVSTCRVVRVPPPTHPWGVLNGDFFHIWTETSYPLERRRSWILNYLRCLLALFKTKPNQTSVYAPLANPVFTDFGGFLIMEIRIIGIGEISQSDLILTMLSKVNEAWSMRVTFPG